MRVSRQGPQKLAALLDGGAFLISTVDSVLPQTMSVLRNSRTVLTTLADAAPALDHTAQNLRRILAGVNAMDGGFRTLVDRGDAPLTALDGIIDDNSNTMVQLLGNLTTVGQLAASRVPALNEMLNSQRGGSALAALSTGVHDGYVWVIADIYPRYACDYDLPRLPPSLANYPEPYLYTYCKNPDPSVLVRGARNAPRPPGDDTAGPPPGYDPLAQTVPTPQVNSSIPTPFGGSPFPPNYPPDPPNWPTPPGWPGAPPPGWTPPAPTSPPQLEGGHHGDQTLQTNQRQGRLRHGSSSTTTRPPPRTPTAITDSDDSETSKTADSAPDDDNTATAPADTDTDDHRGAPTRRARRLCSPDAHAAKRSQSSQPETTPVTPRHPTHRPHLVSGGCATPSPR